MSLTLGWLYSSKRTPSADGFFTGQRAVEVRVFSCFRERREQFKSIVSDYICSAQAGDLLHAPIPNREAAVSVKGKNAIHSGIEELSQEM